MGEVFKRNKKIQWISHEPDHQMFQDKRGLNINKVTQNVTNFSNNGEKNEALESDYLWS